MKYWKKWSFLIWMVVAGALYLSCVDHWQVYAATVERVKDFCRGFAENPGEENSGGAEEGKPGSGGTGSSEGTLTENPDGTATENTDGTAAENTDETAAGDTEGTVSGNTWETATGNTWGTASGNTWGTATGNTWGTATGNTWGTTSGNTWGTATGNTVPREYVAVEDDYFADAVFIGDSRTVGMFEYGGLEEISTFYASKGLTVYKIFDSAIVDVPGQKQKITVEEALRQNSFSKIYLMIGINEMGTGTVETFIEKYKEVVAHLQELQPDAILFVQGIMKVTTERSAKGDYINNEGIEARNVELEKLADGQRIFYLDVNPEICDETGGMEPSYTFDGVHLKGRYLEIWKDFLKEHGIL